MSERVELDGGRIVLYCGDCREVIASWPECFTVDAVITDPPYEEEAHTAMRRTRASIEGREQKAAIPFPAITAAIRGEFTQQVKARCTGWILCFCQAEAVALYKAAFGVAWRRPMIWVKPDSAPQFTGDRPAMGYESIATAWTGNVPSRWNGGGKRGVFTYNCTGWKKVHPTEKPLALMEEFLHLFSDSDNTILDPFMGSGTTGVACIRTGRRFVGIEIDPGYFAIARKRIETELAQRDGRGPLIDCMEAQ